MTPIQGQDALRFQALGDGHNGSIRKVDILVTVLIEHRDDSLHIAFKQRLQAPGGLQQLAHTMARMAVCPRYLSTR